MNDDPNTTLLPYVLDILSREPDLAMTVCKLEYTLKKHFKTFKQIKEKVLFAIEVGQNMGLLSITGDRVCVTFSYRCPSIILKDSTPQDIEGVEEIEDVEMEEEEKPKTPKKPKKKNPKQQKRRRAAVSVSRACVAKFKASPSQRKGQTNKKNKNKGRKPRRHYDD